MPDIKETPVSESTATEETQEVEAEETEATEGEAQQEESAESTEQQEAAAKLEELESKDTTKMSKAQKQALEKQIKKFKLKVDGKEEELEIDLNNEEELKNHLQKSRASSKRMQEAAELRKSAEQFIDMLKKNPRKVLSDPNIGVDLKTLAQEIINQELEDAAKTPEQLEKEKLQRELEEIKEKYKKEEEDRKEREFKRLQAEQEEKIQSNIESALKEGNLPKSPYTVRKMAELMMLALENGKDLQPKDLVPILRKQMNQDIKELFGASNDDVLEELIGKDRISNLRKKAVAKVKQQQVAQTANAVKPTTSSKPAEDKATSKISMRDFLKGRS